MNYAEIKDCDIANGPGVRISVFVSGCRHHCKGCFNEAAWDFNYGKLFDEETGNKVIEMLKPAYVRGITFLGGEPLDPANQGDVCALIKKIRQQCPGKDIWLFTGYVYEKDIMGWMQERCPVINDIINDIDVLVDGPFIEELKDISLVFRGSSNQRLIDMKKTNEKKEIVLWKNN